MDSSSPDEPKVFKNLWAKEMGAHSVQRPICQCLAPQYENSQWVELEIHREEQDQYCPGWHRLNELIEEAAKDGRTEFSPGPEMPPEYWAQIIELPPSIGRLKAVKHLIFYGSSLVRIPPEIGEMESLEKFTPYTSYRLHWFPYEISRCKKLNDSTISTRALYGNYKYRAPFPKLPQYAPQVIPHECSLCRSSLFGMTPKQAWISLPIGTDIVPLLVHACSDECLAQLPEPPENYVQHPHSGGLGLKQPATRF